MHVVVGLHRLLQDVLPVPVLVRRTLSGGVVDRSDRSDGSLCYGRVPLRRDVPDLVVCEPLLHFLGCQCWFVVAVDSVW